MAPIRWLLSLCAAAVAVVVGFFLLSADGTPRSKSEMSRPPAFVDPSSEHGASVPDADGSHRRGGVLLVVSDAAGLPIEAALWSAAKGDDVRGWGTTDTAGRAPIHLGDSIRTNVRISVSADGYYPNATIVQMTEGSPETVASVVLAAEPPLLIVSDDGSPIADYSVELPDGMPRPQRYGVRSLANAGAVIHARGHISLPLGQLPADIRCGFEAHTGKTTVYLLRNESLDRLRLMPVGVAGTVYVRIAMTAGATGISDVGAIAKGSQHLPPEWKAFYGAPNASKDLANGSSQFFVAPGDEVGYIAFSGKNGSVIFGAGRGKLCCWAEDRERFDYELQSEARGEQVVPFAMNPRQWIRKEVTISDAYGRVSPGPVLGRLTLPFHRELTGLVIGDNTVALPPDEPDYSILLFAADLGSAHVRFGPAEVSQDVEVAFSAKELHLRFAEVPESEIPELDVRIGGVVGRWDSRNKRFVLSGVPTRARTVTVVAADRQRYKTELPPGWAFGDGPIADVVVTLGSDQVTGPRSSNRSVR